MSLSLYSGDAVNVYDGAGTCTVEITIPNYANDLQPAGLGPVYEGLASVAISPLYTAPSGQRAVVAEVTVNNPGAPQLTVTVSKLSAARTVSGGGIAATEIKKIVVALNQYDTLSSGPNGWQVVDGNGNIKQSSQSATIAAATAGPARTTAG